MVSYLPPERGRLEPLALQNSNMSSRKSAGEKAGVRKNMNFTYQYSRAPGLPAFEDSLVWCGRQVMDGMRVVDVWRKKTRMNAELKKTSTRFRLGGPSPSVNVPCPMLLRSMLRRRNAHS
jgi:hypothetical protein